MNARKNVSYIWHGMPKELACQRREFHTRREPLGHLFWVAREAHWALQWLAKDGGKTTLQVVQAIWIQMLVKWALTIKGGGGQRKWKTWIDDFKQALQDSLAHPGV